MLQSGDVCQTSERKKEKGRKKVGGRKNASERKKEKGRKKVGGRKNAGTEVQPRVDTTIFVFDSLLTSSLLVFFD
ncbi:MAG TPA: hypothetical protein VM425_15995 [Myxococcota bacterium]|nr:hypothetical protein [Myxococcota bacterium]